jgi:hypothetical protein
MNRKAAIGVVAVGIFVLCLFISSQLQAQDSAATLSGTIKSPSGAAVAHAKVSVKNVSTGQSTETQSDSQGNYGVGNLAPGDYEVSASAEGIGSGTSKVTLALGRTERLDLALTTRPISSTAPTLEDLGISPGQAQGSAQDQARLNKRSHMLMLHQRFGLIAAVPLAATLFTLLGAGGKSTSTADRWAHLALGSATGDLYGISAYYAIRAPRIPGTPTRGPIRVHKILAWIHGPGMILTPILGAIAFDQKSNGEKVHGIASAHGPVAIVTAASYGAAIVAVSFKY